MDRPLTDLLGAFETHSSQPLEHGAWLLFIHELAQRHWPDVGPPPIASWPALRDGGDFGVGLDAAVEALRQQWPWQLRDAFSEVHFAEMPASELTRAAAAAEKASTEAGSRGLQGELFGRIYMQRSGLSAKQARGEFYTPLNVARMKAAILGLSGGEWVIDPACGTGQLLLAVLESLRPEGLALMRSLSIVGIELSHPSSVLCRMQLLLTAADPAQFHIFCADALRNEVVGRDREGVLRKIDFDAVAANPPFGKKQSLEGEIGALELPEEMLYRRVRISSSEARPLLRAGRLVRAGRQLAGAGNRHGQAE